MMNTEATGFTKRLWLWSALILVVGVGAFLFPQTAWACGGENPTVLCVDADADPAGTPDGLSWTEAFTNVQDALVVTNARGGTAYEVWVAEGVYYPDEGAGSVADSEMVSFALRYDNVQLYGGFAATETLRSQRDWETHLTVLSGDLAQDDDDPDGDGVIVSTLDIKGNNAHHVLYLDGVSQEPITNDTVIDGFTITAGKARNAGQHGAGLFCDGRGSDGECSPVLNHVNFMGNRAIGSGGGMFNAGHEGECSPVLTDVTFRGNRAAGGGGMFNGGGDSASKPVLINVTFTDNGGFFFGGGIYNGAVGEAHLTLINVVFSDNHTYLDGAGIYQNTPGAGTSHLTLTNVVFRDNRAENEEGAGIYLGKSRAELTNVTFSDNRAGTSGGAIYLNDSSLTVVNSILWDNEAPAGAQIGIYEGNSSPTITFSRVEGGWAGTGNLNQDPLFASGATSHLGLQANSPALDRGDPDTCPAADLNGNSRNDLRCDMGAYERQLSDGDTIVRRDFTGGEPVSFGPTWISMTLSADDPGPVTVTKHITYPGGTYDTGEVQATWWITSDLNAGWPVTLSLCYTDAEVARLTEANLRAFRWDGLQWTAPISTGLTVNQDANCVTLTGIEGFSAWTLQDTTDHHVPNALVLRSLAARGDVALAGLGAALAGGIVYVLRRRRGRRLPQ